MNLSYQYYFLAKNHETYPAWVQSEGYFNCDHFSKIFHFIKSKF